MTVDVGHPDCPLKKRPLPDGRTLSDYYAAVGGDGQEAANWADKPHRLLYDLIAYALHLEDAASTADQRVAEARAEGVELAARWHDEQAAEMEAWEGRPFVSGRDWMAKRHRVHAAAIRALAPQPAPEGVPNEAIDALEFYADPDSYFAISILADRPAGAFADDFSEDDWTRECDFDRPMPGKRAREALKRLAERFPATGAEEVALPATPAAESVAPEREGWS